MTAAPGLVLAASLLAAAPAPAPAAIPVPQAPPESVALPRRTRNIVVLQSERWIDTVRGTVKNIGARRAEEVVLEVRLRNARGTVLGTERLRVGRLAPGEEKTFQVSLPEKVRSATRWEFTSRAAFGPRARGR